LNVYRGYKNGITYSLVSLRNSLCVFGHGWNYSLMNFKEYKKEGIEFQKSSDEEKEIVLKNIISAIFTKDTISDFLNNHTL